MRSTAAPSPSFENVDLDGLSGAQTWRCVDGVVRRRIVRPSENWLAGANVLPVFPTPAALITLTTLFYPLLYGRRRRSKE